MTQAQTSSGIARDDLDPAVRPQDDLFRHVNGAWIARTEIPADKPRYGAFLELAEAAEKAVRTIVEEAQNAPDGSEARKFGDLFTSFMDTERIQARGTEPIQDWLRLADEVSSIDDLLAVVGRLEREGLSGFYQLFVDNDPGAPDRYLVFFEQGGISLPDESYYREEGFAPVRAAYLAHIQRMFELAGVADAAGRAQRVFDLETELAAAHWDNVTNRDSQKTYNPYSWPDAAGLAPGVDLGVWREAVAAPDGALETVVLRQPSFTEGLAALLSPDRLESWRDWLRWQVVHGAAPYLTEEIVEENFAFYGRTLSGTPELRARWKRGVSFVEGAMGEAVGRVYVERHFPPEAKAQMDALVGNLVDAYRDSIRELGWMGEDTKARALDKLASFTPKIGFPAKWRDYSRLAADPADLIGNVRAASRFEFDRELAKIGRPIDRDEWFMTPQTVNAYYNPGFNEIVFPAAILQLPFFDPARDDASNYGAIGAVIGHEIGHGFDDQGSRFDGDGRLTDWWTADDRSAFDSLTRSLIAQYDALAPAQVPEHHVNGALTIGENIGDLGGLGIAWRAYQKSLRGAEPEILDGFSGAQRFYLAWATAWRQKARDEELIRLLATDPHAPNEFRCNQIVRNIDSFYAAFGVVESDDLWLDPEERVRIW